MVINTPTVSAAQAAIILYRQLGPIRAWSDFLSDNIRGRQDIMGLTLKPCAMKKDCRAMRPRYSLNEIHDFIEGVKSRMPEAGPEKRIVPVILAIDTARPWRHNKFDATGFRVGAGAALASAL